MGDSSPGASLQQTNSTNTATAPPAIEGMLKNISQQASQNLLDNPNAPAFFTDPTYAQFSPQTESALNDLNTRGAQGSPVQRAGAANIQDTLGGKFLDIGNNPYFQGALTAAFRPQNEDLVSRILPLQDSKFSGAGRYGGGAHIDTSGDLYGQLAQSQSDAAAKAALGAYTGERSNQMSALQMLPSFQAADYGDLQARLQAGGARDVQAQKAIDEAMARDQYAKNAQRDYLVRNAQALQAIYPGGATSGTGYQTGEATRPGGGTGAVVGAGMQGAGLLLKTLPMLFPATFSDRRDKTDIEELGIDPLTGFKTYAYRYKTDPKSYPKTVGPMAQDIEKVRPDLVAEIGGRKVVQGGLM